MSQSGLQRWKRWARTPSCISSTSATLSLLYWRGAVTDGLISPFRSALVVTAEPCGCSAPTGWARTPPTSSLRWFWSIPSTRLSDATQTPSGSQRLCTSTGRCAAWPLQERRAVVWARVTSSTWPSEALAALPGRGATPCSCTAIVRPCHTRLYIHQNKKSPFMVTVLCCLWLLEICNLIG